MNNANDGLWGHSSPNGDPMGYVILSSSKPTVHVVMDPDLGPPSKVLIGCWHGELEVSYLYGLSRLLIKPTATAKLLAGEESILWLHPSMDARDRRNVYLLEASLVPALQCDSVAEGLELIERYAKHIGVWMSTTREKIDDCYTLDPSDHTYYVATRFPGDFVSVGGELERKAPC